MRVALWQLLPLRRPRRVLETHANRRLRSNDDWRCVMSRAQVLFAFSLVAVLTGVLALIDGRMAAIYGSFCVAFAIVIIDLAERPGPREFSEVSWRGP